MSLMSTNLGAQLSAKKNNSHARNMSNLRQKTQRDNNVLTKAGIAALDATNGGAADEQTLDFIMVSPQDCNNNMFSTRQPSPAASKIKDKQFNYTFQQQQLLDINEPLPTLHNALSTKNSGNQKFTPFLSQPSPASVQPDP